METLNFIQDETVKEGIVGWFTLPNFKKNKPPDEVTINERIVALEEKYINLAEQNQIMFQKMFLDNGSKSLVSAVHLHDDNIAENKESILKLEEEVTQRFEKIDKKLDDIHDCIASAQVFNVFNIIDHLFRFGETNAGRIIRVCLILLLGGITSPMLVNKIESFIKNVPETIIDK